MFWVAVFVVAIAILVAIAYGRSVDVRTQLTTEAEYERIQRERPGSAIARLGRAEFQLLKIQAVRRRLKLWAIAFLQKFVVVFAIVFALVYIALVLANGRFIPLDFGTIFALSFVSAVVGIVPAHIWYRKRSEVPDTMDLADEIARQK